MPPAVISAFQPTGWYGSAACRHVPLMQCRSTQSGVLSLYTAHAGLFSRLLCGRLIMDSFHQLEDREDKVFHPCVVETYSKRRL